MGASLSRAVRGFVRATLARFARCKNRLVAEACEQFRSDSIFSKDAECHAAYRKQGEFPTYVGKVAVDMKNRQISESLSGARDKRR